MTVIRERGTQIMLGENLPIKVYEFPPEVVVYPQGHKRGVLQGDLEAVRIEGKKIKGYSAFQSRNIFTLFLDGNFSSFPAGTFFGAPVSLAHKIEIK